MTTAHLVNCSQLPRRTWTECSVNQKLVEDFGVECTFVSDIGHHFRAVRGKNRGDVSTIYRVFAHYGVDRRIDGRIINEPFISYDPSSNFYKVHRWVSDKVQDLLPIFNVDGSDSTIERLMPTNASAAHQRWHLRHRTGGFWIDWFTDLLHDDPVAKFRCLIRWSDRDSREWDRHNVQLAMRIGELPIIDCAKLLGIELPQKFFGGWALTIGRNVNFPDGAGIAFCGELPCFVADPSTVDIINNVEDRESWDDLRASLLGPTFGVGGDWDGNWLANRYVPRFNSIYTLRQESDERLSRFRDKLLSTGTWHAPRPLGCGPVPGATGNQQDFGATKGTFALFDAENIRELLFSAYGEAHRGTLHLERDGTPVRARIHPDWRTWSGKSHTSGSDLLGKDAPGWGDGLSNGWSGYDDEHRSQNTLAAAIALCDDPVLDLLAMHQIEIDLASSRHHTGNPDAARAQGRTPQAWVNLLSVLQLSSVVESEDLRKLIAKRRLNANLALTMLSSSESPMRPIAIIGPDARKPIRDQAGQLMPIVGIWEHALATVAYSVIERDSHEPSMLLLALSRLMVKYGVTAEMDLVADIAWFGGAEHPVPLDRASPYKILAGTSGVGNWTLAGIIAATHALQGSTVPGDAALVEKGRGICRHFTGGLEAGNVTGAEWWACVPSIASVT